jgi:ATP phosphoribosyltransferase regulatory subunit
MTARPPFAEEILALFAERGTILVDVPIIQPADPFLDMAGEDLRRRIFLTESESGESLCLRPEFTIPVCLDHIRSRASTPRRYAYLGEVFRQRREGASEFFQAGIEDLGNPDRAEADAASLADAHGLLARVLPGRRLVVMLGDQAVFEAVLAALGLPSGWQKRLLRAFGSPSMLEAALADLSNPPVNGRLPEAVARLAGKGDIAGLTAHIANAMEEAGLSISASRTPHEIASRLVEKYALAHVRLAPKVLAALRRFLALRIELEAAAGALERFARETGLVLDATLEGFAARAAAIAGHGLPSGDIIYDAGFGRPLDYYTGLVFEVTTEWGRRALAGGGRYDRLLTLLGAPEAIPGVGFSVWLDRVEGLRAGRA